MASMPLKGGTVPFGNKMPGYAVDFGKLGRAEARTSRRQAANQPYPRDSLQSGTEFRTLLASLRASQPCSPHALHRGPHIACKSNSKIQK